MKELSDIPQKPGPPVGDPGLTAAREGAALVGREDAGILRLTGKDPLGMLNAVLTNSVPEQADEGAYALLLSPKGRVQTDLRVLKAADAVLIVTEPEGVGAAREVLGRYAPFSRVSLEDLSNEWSVLGLYGPSAQEHLDVPELPEHGTAEVGSVLIAGVATPTVGYDLIGPSEIVARAGEDLASRGAVLAGPDLYETIRVEAGLPRFGADLTPDNFPGEAGILDRAVDFSKGCYPGQETVARMRYRGHPNKTLYRLSAPHGLAAGTQITQEDEKAVGTLTSVAPIPTNGEVSALGYLSRKTNLDAPLMAGDAELRVLGEVG